jgi:hypothetical protein
MSSLNLRGLILITSNEYNQQNIFAKEPTMYTDKDYTVPHNERAELLNGRLAMLGFIAAVGAYAVTGQIIPGVF